MSREADPSRKPMLRAQILEYLLDKPLATVSFRTLAKALDVSAFTLVYHFGSRAELLAEIISEISLREFESFAALRGSSASLESYISGLEQLWEWSVHPRHIQMQRLEFEAAMMEALHTDSPHHIRAFHQRWLSEGIEAMVNLGVGVADAEIEARAIVDSFFGLQYDLVVTHDVERATAAFTRIVQGHRERLEELMRTAGTLVDSAR